MEITHVFDSSPSFKSNYTSQEIQELNALVSLQPKPSTLIQQHSAHLSPKKRKSKQGKLLLVSLLENFCDLYDSSPDKNKKLFVAICKQLSTMGIIDQEDFLDELASVRTIYKKAFKDMILETVLALKEDDMSSRAIEYAKPPLLSPSSTASVPIQTTFEKLHLKEPLSASTDSKVSVSPDSKSFGALFSDIQPSRFRDEYRAICKLGRGAFGQVWKVQNMLDKAFYAVKCIDSTQFERSEYLKLLREVKSHAKLSHGNVVRYFSSWLEHQAIRMTGNSEREDGDDSDEFSLELPQDDTTRQRKTVSDGQPDLINTIYLFIQMELCQFTLENWIHARNHLYAKKAECQKIRSREALQIFSQILEGLRYIHKKKFIHRDIKPQNIYWKANEEEWDDVEAPDKSVLEVIANISGEWKIGDFGLVANELDCRSPISGTKNIIAPWYNASEYKEQDQTFGVGTMMYASPEQLNESSKIKYTNKSDVYSLGILLFELLHPFSTGMERIKVLQGVRDGILPETFVKQWPKESMLVLWMTEEDYNTRPTISDILKFELGGSHCDPITTSHRIVEVEKKSAYKGRNSKSLSIGHLNACTTCDCCKTWEQESILLKERISELERQLLTHSKNS